LEGLGEKLKTCLDDTACSATDKATKLKELQSKLLTVQAEKATTAEKKEVEGDANMLVSKPSTCTSATNCKYICEEFVGIDGAKEEAVDLKKTGATVVVRRQLSTSTLVYGTDGYEADNDKNSVGGATETYTSDTSFPEEITAGASYYVAQTLMLVVMLLGVLYSSGG